MENRLEQDSLGEVSVLSDKLWGAQTQRSLEHFSIGDDLIPRELIDAYAIQSRIRSPSSSSRRACSIRRRRTCSTSS